LLQQFENTVRGAATGLTIGAAAVILNISWLNFNQPLRIHKIVPNFGHRITPIREEMGRGRMKKFCTYNGEVLE
jgi:hypothetical protein